MNVLVTGATGFIGSNLVLRLIEKGHSCRCLVRKDSNVDLFKDCTNVDFFYGDIAKKETLKNVCKDIDVVIHSAGILAKWNSSIDELRPVNAMGLANLKDELIDNKVKHIIHLSAGGVTGPVIGEPANEDYSCKPVTPYEKTKWEGEIMAMELYEKYKLPIVVARPTFTYGPGDPHKLPLFRAVKKGRFLFIGSGESTNHPVFIDDLIDGIMLLMEKEVVGETFILGGERPVSKKELIGTIAAELHVKDNFIHIPRGLATMGAHVLVLFAKMFGFEPMLTPSRVSMMADNWGYSIDKAKERLGYDPKVDLKTGIKRTAQSYIESNYL